MESKIENEAKTINPFEVRTWLIQNQANFHWDEDGYINDFYTFKGKIFLTLWMFLFSVPYCLVRYFGLPLLIAGTVFFFFPNDFGWWILVLQMTLISIGIFSFVISEILIRTFPDPILNPNHFQSSVYNFLVKSFRKKDSHEKSYKRIYKRVKMYSKTNFNKNWSKLSLSIVFLAQGLILLRTLPWNTVDFTIKEVFFKIWELIKYELIISINTISLGITERWTSPLISIPSDNLDVILFDIIRIFFVFAFIDTVIATRRNLFQKPFIKITDNIFGLSQFLKQHNFGERSMEGVKSIYVYDFGKPIENQWENKEKLLRDDILEWEEDAINLILKELNKNK